MVCGIFKIHVECKIENLPRIKNQCLPEDSRRGRRELPEVFPFVAFCQADPSPLNLTLSKNNTYKVSFDFFKKLSGRVNENLSKIYKILPMGFEFFQPYCLMFVLVDLENAYSIQEEVEPP